jgi:hypothetical protein
MIENNGVNERLQPMIDRWSKQRYLSYDRCHCRTIVVGVVRSMSNDRRCWMIVVVERCCQTIIVVQWQWSFLLLLLLFVRIVFLAGPTFHKNFITVLCGNRTMNCRSCQNTWFSQGRCEKK